MNTRKKEAIQNIINGAKFITVGKALDDPYIILSGFLDTLSANLNDSEENEEDYNHHE